MSVHELMRMFRGVRGTQALQKGVSALKKLDDEEARQLQVLITHMVDDARSEARRTAQHRFMTGRMP